MGQLSKEETCKRALKQPKIKLCNYGYSTCLNKKDKNSLKF